MIEIKIKTFGEKGQVPKVSSEFEEKNIRVVEVGMVLRELELLKQALLRIEFEPEFWSEEIDDEDFMGVKK